MTKVEESGKKIDIKENFLYQTVVMNRSKARR